MRRGLALLPACALACLASAGGGRGETRVYYYGLFVNTAVPISERMIESGYYDLTSVIREIVPDILRALAASDGPYVPRPSHNVRLKVVPPSGPPILLDFGGNVSGIGRPHRLSAESQARLRRLIFSAFPADGPWGRIEARPPVERASGASRG